MENHSRTSSLYVSTYGNEYSLPNTAEAQQYMPLDPKLLRADKACDFPIYVFPPDRDHFILFKAEHLPIRQDQLDLLTQEGRRPVFIPRKNSYELNQYLSENLIQLIEEPNMPLVEKTQKFHAMASTVMKSLFESPPDIKTFVKSAKNVSDSIAALIIAEPQAILQLNRLRSYDYYTYSHSMNVTVLSVGLFQEIHKEHGPEQIRDLTRGVLLHDIGKCDIPTELTNKPGPLSNAEWFIMRSHTVKGHERLLDDTDLSVDSRYVALYHHEALDGSGYPTGIKKEEIPLTSRICKVVDVYDALTSRRPYKDGMPPFDALQLMTKEMSNKVDLDILKEFILFLEKMGKLTVRRVRV